VPDWTNEVDGFTSLNFAPADPLYYAYSIELGTASGCGNSASNTDVYNFLAEGDLDGDGTLSTFQLAAGTNPDNALYRAPGINQISALE
jgi:hypothetical protein